jgi:chemotaxis protein MotB
MMGKTPSKNAGGHEQDTNAWMVTFSDLIMLLLTFFVLILTMSSMDQKKLKEMFRHLQEAVGILEFSNFGEITPPAGFAGTYRDKEAMIILDQSMVQNLLAPSPEVENKAAAALEEFKNTAEVMEDERGIVFSFQESILFRPGEVRIRREAEPFLARLADAIESCRNPILVTGHSDDTPLRDKAYASNWELSLHRGLSVLDYFLNRKRLPSSRFMVGAAGSSRPVSPNDTPEGRARNRRVEIIFRHIEGL